MEGVRRLQEEELATIKAIFGPEFEDIREKRRTARQRKRLSENQDSDAVQSPLQQHLQQAQPDVYPYFSIHISIGELSSAAGEKFPEMCTDIHFKLSANYPCKEKPVIEIKNPVNVSPELCTHIKSQLDKLADERIEEQQPMIFDLVERARELMQVDQETRKLAAAQKRDEEERRWRDIDNEVKKRADQNNASIRASSSTRPTTLLMDNLGSQSTMSAVTKMRVRSGSASVDTEPKAQTTNDTFPFVISDTGSHSMEIRPVSVVKENFLGDKVSLFLAHSANQTHLQDVGANTYFLLKGTINVDALTPMQQVTKIVDSIEREVDALRQSLPNNVDKHLMRLLAFRAIPAELSFQLVFSFPGYGVFLSDVASKQSVKLPLASIRSITHQIASGLRFLHLHNILHRFLIPELVFISLGQGTEEASLMLYGVGKHIAENIASSTRNKIIDARLKFVRRFRESKRTDVLLLGCVVYYMVTGGTYPNSFPVKPLSSANQPNQALNDFVNALIAEKETDRPAMPSVFSLPFLDGHDKLARSALKSDEREEDGEDNSIKEDDSSDSEKVGHVSENRAIDGEEISKDSRLYKDFRKVEVLGEGGFGKCFKAQNKLDGRFYAVKRIRLPTNDNMMNRMILREVKLLSRLNHENIVRYFNAWQEYDRVTRRRKHHDTLSPASPLVSSEPSDSNVTTPKSNVKIIDRKCATTNEQSLSFGIDFAAPPPVLDDEDGDDWSFTDEDASSEDDVDDDSCTSEELSIFPQRLQLSSDNKVSRRQPQNDSSEYSSSDIVQFERSADAASKFGDGDSKSGGGAIISDSQLSAGSSVNFQMLYLCIQMELCDSTLHQLISTRALFTDEQPADNSLANCQKRAWILFKQLVDGLAYIHRQGMIHRDLNPKNIFLTSEDRVKIGDFGLALHRQPANTRQNSVIVVSPDHLNGGSGDPNTPLTGAFPEVVGTSFYISPEMLSSGEYDQKTDMFSLGVVLLEMFYYFETGYERVNVLSSIQQRGKTDNIYSLVPSAFFEKPALARAVALIDKLTRREPKERPTADDLLHSDDIPTLSDIADKQMSKLIQSIASNNTAPEFKQMLSALFSSSARSLTLKDDFLYDCFLYQQRPDDQVAWKKSLFDKMIREFLHRFSCSSYYWPVLMPVIQSRNNHRIYPNSVDLETVLSSTGILLSLPYDLRIAFARNVVRSNINECRRFEISRVYRGARVERGYPAERTELAVDIVVPLSTTTDGDTQASSCIVLSELVCICIDLWKQFVFSSTTLKSSKSSSSKSRKTITNLLINHLDLLRAILITLPLSNDSAKGDVDQKIDAFIAGVHQKLSGPEMSPQWPMETISQLLKEIFPGCAASSFQDYTRVVNLVHQLLVDEPSWTDVEKLWQLARNFKKAPNGEQATTVARNAITQLRAAMHVCRALYPNVNVIIQTNFMHQFSIYSKFVFRLEQATAPNTASSRQSTPQENKRQGLAVGGDYSHILDLLRFAPPTERQASFSRMAVGFSYDFDNFQRLTVIDVGAPLLSLPFLGEVSIALAPSSSSTPSSSSSADQRDGSTSSISNEKKLSALVDLLRFGSQLRSAGFAVASLLHHQAVQVLENSEAYLSAHLPVTRIVVLLKHERPKKISNDLSPIVKVSFEIYYRVTSTSQTDSRIVEVTNSSGDFSNVVMTVQNLCASSAKSRPPKTVGVFDAIMSSVLVNGLASIALGATTPSTETVPLPSTVAEQATQSQQLQQQQQTSQQQQPQQQSNTLRGGLSAYTDILWLPEERLTDKYKRTIENQLVSALSPKLRTFNPSTHIDIVVLEVDAAAVGTLACWLSGQVQRLNALLAAQPTSAAANVASSWSSSVFQIGGDFDKAITERHARYRRYLTDKIPEIVDIIVTRISTHHQQQLSFIAPSSGRQQSSSSLPLSSLASSSSSSIPLPVMVLYAIKDNGYQFVM